MVVHGNANLAQSLPNCIAYLCLCKTHMPIVSAGRCSALPYVDNTMLVGEYTSEIHSNATFVCCQGYRFRDGLTTKSIACKPNLDWDNLEECV